VVTAVRLVATPTLRHGSASSLLLEEWLALFVVQVEAREAIRDGYGWVIKLRSSGGQEWHITNIKGATENNGNE